MIRRHPLLDDLARFPIKSACRRRTCVAIQTNTRTLNLYLGLPHLVALPASTQLPNRNPRSHASETQVLRFKTVGLAQWAHATRLSEGGFHLQIANNAYR